ncbi:ERF family protein [Enterococcus faecalis]|uniref:ERF family protein n=1 Tax=Enterococcus faecalis TaxID=1351 RepID=UPI001CF068B2|nr:ERF family protein [Enterococcus faecalis]UNT40125.1 ERF family protein [Enterococcus faecalis]HAP4452815.1 ERF family protein [Enterococcus faecalis]HAP4903142.1 ERF family protein [Enterococcus faecalis]
MTEATKTDFSKLNVYQKLAYVRQKAPYIQKSKRGQQYSYVGSSDVLSALNTVINQVGLILKPEIVAHQVRESQDEVWKVDKVKKEPVAKKRTTYFTELELMLTWINIHNPSEIVACSWYSQGVDIEGEKGVGKALTYAEKYFLLKFFNIATDDDDPDKYQKEQLKNTTITERQIDMLNASISRVAELAGQEFEAVKSLAINDSDLNPKKAFEEYSAYDYGVISKLLAKWINFYESRQKVQEDKK